MTILEKIIKQKEKEVAVLKKRNFTHIYQPKNPIMSIKQTFSSSENLQIIAEIKRSSPSKGAINMHINPVEQAKKYEAFGAKAISVLTDHTFFKGSMDDLYAVRKAVNLPILCKDFIIDPIQIDQAKVAGANIILLIVAALSTTQLKELYHYAKKLNLDVLCEVHNGEEMQKALTIGAEIIGINNRNLKTFEVDLRTTEKLAPTIKDPSTLLISESGVKTRTDALRLSKAGVSGLLIGETLMQASNLDETFENLKVLKGQIPNAR